MNSNRGDQVRRDGRARLAVLISGSGRSLENLAAVIARGELEARIELVLSSRRTAFGLERARRLGLEACVRRRCDFATTADFSAAVFDELRQRSIDIACLMGFLSLLEIPADFDRRVLNIHPALLPDFGGKGMYGSHVHEAVLRAGRAQSGCTVHYCNNAYDQGAILLQRRCPVLPDDTAETLAARVFELEKLAFPEALRQVLGS